jgi:hypothetical protein
MNKLLSKILNTILFCIKLDINSGDCQDINECATGVHNCQESQRCDNRGQCYKTLLDIIRDENTTKYTRHL